MRKRHKINAIALVALFVVTGCSNSGSTAQTPDITEAMMACGITEPSTEDSGGKYSYTVDSETGIDAATVTVTEARDRVSKSEKRAGHASAASLLSERWGRLADASASKAALEVAVLGARKRGEDPYMTVDKTIWDTYFAAVPIENAECTGLVTVLNLSTSGD